MGPFGFLWLSAALASAPRRKTEGLRANRALRATHSRREANRLIAEGRLLVNGAPIVSPDDRLLPGDQVKLDGEPVLWTEGEIEPHRYIKLHKPAGVVCTTDRRVNGNIIDYFESFGGADESNARRVYPIGRLDRESTGLILLTSDGSIVNPLLRSGEDKTKEYRVTTEPRPTNDNVRQLAAGVVITTIARKDGWSAPVTAMTRPCIVERTESANNNELRFVLGEGRNRQIRKMAGTLGLEVTGLHRVNFAGVSLRGCEAPGDWASLTVEEELAIGARKPPTRNERRTPEERARRKAKKEAKKRFGRR